MVAAEGQVDDALCIIKSGDAFVRRGARDELTKLHRGEYFGEQALLPRSLMKQGKRKLSVIAQGSAPLVVLALTAESLEQDDHLLTWAKGLTEAIAAVSDTGMHMPMWACICPCEHAYGHAHAYAHVSMRIPG